MRKQRDLFYTTVTVLAQAVEMRDEYTGNHTARVTAYASLIGQHLELSAKELHLIRIGTPLHDIGKIGIDDEILKKESKLTFEEFEIMKTHTVKGAKILEQIADLAEAIPIVRSHHERWDGGGYPDGLAGDKIDRLARIVAVADAFDAMTSERPYRRGMAAEAAFAEVERMLGKQFDPEAAAAFLSIKPRIIQEMQSETKKLNLAQMGSLRLAAVKLIEPRTAPAAEVASCFTTACSAALACAARKTIPIFEGILTPAAFAREMRTAENRPAR